MLVGGIEGLFRRLPVALYRSARDGTLLAANPALAQLLGYSTLEELDQGPADVESFYVDPQQRHLWLEEITASGVVLNFDVELRRRDGSTVWVSDTARAVFDEEGELQYCEGALIDMSQKVEVERAKDEFIATVSHELRNPLSVLLGMAQELAADYGGFTDAERQEMADVMASQADDASWIIEDLLVAYRGDHTQLSVAAEEFDVVEEIRRVLGGIDQSVALDVGEGTARVVGDPRRTRQVLRNLVSNALKYGGPEVAVETRGSPNRDVVEILVRDNGQPLEPEEASRIFEAFERGGLSGDGKSVGLGLSVARKLTTAMGGSLVYRHDGRHAAFIVTLPAAT